MNDDRSRPARITVYATPFCGDTRRARRVLDDLQIDYDFVDIRFDPEAARWVEQVNNGFRSSPTIAFPDGSTLTEPSERALLAKLEQQPESRVNGGPGQALSNQYEPVA